jgi:hypothetical protein
MSEDRSENAALFSDSVRFAPDKRRLSSAISQTLDITGKNRKFACRGVNTDDPVDRIREFLLAYRFGAHFQAF